MLCDSAETPGHRRSTAPPACICPGGVQRRCRAAWSGEEGSGGWEGASLQGGGALSRGPPAPGRSHDAVKALQAALLTGHLAAEPQRLLHTVPCGDRGLAQPGPLGRGGPHPAASLAYSPWDRLKMTEALKVSPAPRVSTTRGGGKASECSSRPSGPRASAPCSAQAQTSTALQDPPLSWVGGPALGPSLREVLPPTRDQTPSLCTPRAPSRLPPTHPFLTRPYKPLRASLADRNPRCLATSLLTNTCKRWREAEGHPNLARLSLSPPAAQRCPRIICRSSNTAA